MKIAAVRQRAYAMGLTGISRIKKGELIRTIQRQEGNRPCFGAEWRFSCEHLACCWREDCQVTRPG
jgi:hypothetical protein